MNKSLDVEIYNELDHQFCWEDNRTSQRKILYTRILKLEIPKNSDVYVEIAKLGVESGQLQKVLIQLKRATIINPCDSYAQISLAEVFLKLQKYYEAFPCVEKVLCLSPFSRSAHSLVISIFQERGALEDIDSFYQRIANLLPDKESISDLYYQSAQVLVSYKQNSKALEMYKQAFEASPRDSRCHYQYGKILYIEGFFEEASIQFENVKKIDPRHQQAFNNAAFLQYCLGKLQKALEDLEYIIENGLESTGTYANFILVLFHLDKEEEVINLYRDLLQQNLEGGNRHRLQSMYEEALRMTQRQLERDDIDEETRKFNLKKIEGINLVLSFVS